MRFALCQINPTVGDFRKNTDIIVDYCERAVEAGAKAAFFPELSLCAYPPRDLLCRAGFLRACESALDHLCSRLPSSLWVFVGMPYRDPTKPKPYNAVVAIHRRDVQAHVYKQLLPNEDVFDESRYFLAGSTTPPLFTIDGMRVGISICEDAWNAVDSDQEKGIHSHNPLDYLVEQGAECIVNLAASPFNLPKVHSRQTMLASIARHYERPVVFVNQVGATDELIFDGHSAVFLPDGHCAKDLAAFEEDLQIARLSRSASRTPSKPPLSDSGLLLDALSMGVRDYAKKCHFKGVILGLSGGIDSALTACIAARALGPEHVLGISMPTRFSSQHSLDDARDLAMNTGIRHQTIAIDDLYQRYLDLLIPHLSDASGKDVSTKEDHLSIDEEDFSMPPKVSQHSDLGSGQSDVTFENIQARIRCALLMAFANKHSLLLLNTGNKSEIAVGYCTLYGDMGGGLSVIGDVYKTSVYALAAEINRETGGELIPRNILTKEPSAELRADQKDSDSLPSYSILDGILHGFIEEGRSANEIEAKGFDQETINQVLTLLQRSEYKRRQLPPCLIVSKKAFASGRRYPIAQAYRGYDCLA